MTIRPGKIELVLILVARTKNKRTNIIFKSRQVSSDDSGLGEVQENSDKTDDSGTKGTIENLDKK